MKQLSLAAQPRHISLAAQTGRTLDMLEFLGRSHLFGVDDMAREMECDRRTACRYIAVLVARDLVAPVRVHGKSRWRQGPERVRGFAR